MGKAKQILEGCEGAECTTSEAPLSFLEICESIKGTLLRMSEELEMAAGRIEFYVDEARKMKMKKEKKKG